MRQDDEERARALAGQMTLEEKIGMIHGAELFKTAGVKRLGIPPLAMSDGPMGVRREFEPDAWRATGRNDDFVTYLPCNSAVAATWNRDLAERTGEALGEEARGRGKDVILGPGVNIKRSPLCGRNFEYFSEDPYLTSELACRYIKGIQKWDVAACVKHFAANNQETDRLWVEAEVPDEALEEIYFPAFKAAVQQGGAYAVMGAYNLLKGVHCCQNSWLLDDILRKEWGFDGVVISDWGGVHDTDKAALCGLDIEMSVTGNFDEYYLASPLKQKVEQGAISEAEIDRKVFRILMLMMKLHMLGGERKSGSFNTTGHRETALETARESVVLLKNEGERLPLRTDGLKRLLVVGENADCMHADGGGSAELRALYELTPLMALKMLLGGNVQADYAPGYCRDPEGGQTEENWQAASLENGGGHTQKRREEGEDALSRTRERLCREAAALASGYDDVIFIGGLNHKQDSEGNDREDMRLPYGQDRLIGMLLDANPNTVIAFVGGSPVEMGAWINRARAVVWSWYAGMEGARALAETLLGLVNPSGKLPETFYKKHTDCSAHALGEFGKKTKIRYSEGLFVGYRYNDTFGIKPQFCFGHGLSYTEFAYGPASVTEDEEGVALICRITNTGKREGKEVAQVYGAWENPPKGRPARELKGFEKVELKPGETKTVRIALSGIQKGMRLQAGSSLADIRCETEVL